jgi:exonuclease III
MPLATLKNRKLNMKTGSSICWTFFALSIAVSSVSGDDARLNQIQVIGTHNSYHIAPQESVLGLIAAKDRELARSLDYTHRPLGDQFTRLGIRQIELDIFADPDGGLYAEPVASKMAADAKQPHDPHGLLQKPGMKVLHVQDIDHRTTALTLVDALTQVRAWSQDNPGHCPIMIMIEVKEDSIGGEFTQPHPFRQAEMDAIDAEILSVFDPSEILKPDDVRGSFETLRQAITEDGWPPLDDVRGKVMFALDNGGEMRDLYLEGHRSLRDRLLFVSVEESHPAAAFMKINDPVNDFERIHALVQKGFLVRTRADAGTKESRLNESNRREKAFTSGAHFVSTDYPEPDRRFSDYEVRFEDDVVARANPVTGKAEWSGRDFDGVATAPQIDGVFSEWSEEHLVARDAKGDATAAFDVTKVAARTNGTVLYLHFDIGKELNLQNGLTSDGTLRAVIDLPGDRQLTVDFRVRTAVLRGSDAKRIAWSGLDFVCLPTYASDEYELRIDLDELGLSAGDEITLNFSGSDALENAVSIVLDESQEQQPNVSLARSDNAHVRIANLNTLYQGLGDPDRSAQITRLLTAAQADVYCFQEELDEGTFRKAAQRMVPHQINLCSSNGCGIATRLPLEPVRLDLERGAAALVELPNRKHLVVVSVHFKCCGYAGSWQDDTRVYQAEQLADRIRRMRQGEYGEKCKNGGIVVIGDYNLVGSRKPLDILRKAGLTDLLLRAAGDGAAYTWRGLRREESFWPGRLDVVAMTPRRSNRHEV